MSFTFFIHILKVTSWLHFLHGMGVKLGGVCYTANVSAEKQEEGLKYVSFTFEFVRLEKKKKNV